MWIVRETENELTIKAFPLLMWAMVLGCFVLGFLIGRIYIEAYSFSAFAKLFEGDLGDIFINFFVLTFTPVSGLVLFHLSPLVITKFNSQNQTVAYTTYTLLGKRTRKIGFSILKGGVRVKSEEYEDSTYHLLYIELESGEKLDLSKELSWWEGRVYDVAVKANEFLQTKSRQLKLEREK